MARGEPCIIINRTSKNLDVTQNGEVKLLRPGENMLTTDWIRFAKLQNPRRGTFDESGMNGEYLVGVKGSEDDCSMIPPGKEHKGPDRFDRSTFSGEGRDAVEVRSGVSDPMRRVPADMLPENAMFSRPDR